MGGGEGTKGRAIGTRQTSDTGKAVGRSVELQRVVIPHRLA